MQPDDPYSRVDYRRLIAWPERIRREGPFLERLFSGAPLKKLLDLGAGTGEHARFLGLAGFEVLGIDASEAMLAKARDAENPPGVRFELGDMRNLEQTTTELFGGAICLGNVLPHLTTEDDLRSFARSAAARLAPGATLLVQILNYDRIIGRNERHLPLNFRDDEDGEIVFLRLLKSSPNGSVLFFPTTLKLRPNDEESPVEVVSSRRVQLRGWRHAELDTIVRAEGFASTRLLGGFDESPFDPVESRDLMLLATK